MMEINNLTAWRIDRKKIKRIAEKVLKEEKGSGKKISIAFIEKDAIKELNRKYRKKDGATDVLSFDYGDFGEVVICPHLSENVVRSLIHGILHLLGYDHEKGAAEEKKMKEKELCYLSKTCLKII